MGIDPRFIGADRHQHRVTSRTERLPLSHPQLCFRSQVRIPCRGIRAWRRRGERTGRSAATVLRLTVYRLRGRHHYLLHGQFLRHDQLVEERRPYRVTMEEGGEIGQIILVRRQMDHRVDATQGGQQGRSISHVTV